MRLERIFVINLRRRAERKRAVLRQLAQVLPDVPVETVIAVDGSELDLQRFDGRPHTLFPTWKDTTQENPFYSRDLRRGEIGCSLSHLDAWQRIVRAKIPCALIVEDDARLARDLSTRLDMSLDALPSGWDLLYVGRKPLHPENEEVEAPGIVQARFSYCSFAYVLSLGGAKKLATAGLETSIIPVDEFLPALYDRHPRDDVRARFGEGDQLRAYALTPGLADHSTQSDTEASASVRDSSSVFSIAAMMQNAPRDFAEKFWQQQWTVGHGALDRLSGLGDLPAFAMPLEIVRMHPEPDTSAWGRLRIPTTRYANGDAAVRLYNEGYSLYLTRLEQSVPGLRDYCIALERELGIAPGEVTCEGFFSKRGVGLPPHFDLDDNFNVQITGQKRWRIAAEPRIQHPHRTHFMGKPLDTDMANYVTGTLPAVLPQDCPTIDTDAGSVVYLPRGTWHQTESLTDGLAIAFSIKPQSWGEVLVDALRRATVNHSELRRFAYGRYSPSELATQSRSELATALATLRDMVSDMDVVELEAKALGPSFLRPPPRYCRAVGVELELVRGEPNVLLVTGEETLEVEVAESVCALLREVIKSNGTVHPEKILRGDLPIDSVVAILDELVALGGLARVVDPHPGRHRHQYST